MIFPINNKKLPSPGLEARNLLYRFASGLRGDIQFPINIDNLLYILDVEVDNSYPLDNQFNEKIDFREYSDEDSKFYENDNNAMVHWFKDGSNLIVLEHDEFDDEQARVNLAIGLGMIIYDSLNGNPYEEYNNEFARPSVVYAITDRDNLSDDEVAMISFAREFALELLAPRDHVLSRADNVSSEQLARLYEIDNSSMELWLRFLYGGPRS